MSKYDVLSVKTAMCWFNEADRMQLFDDLKSDPDLADYRGVIDSMDFSGFEPDMLPFTRKDNFLYDHWSRQSIDMIIDMAKVSRVITSVPQFSIYTDDTNIIYLRDEKYYRAFRSLYGEELVKTAAASSVNGMVESLWIFNASSLPMYYCMKKAVKKLQKKFGLSLHRKGSLGAEETRELLSDFIPVMDLFPVVNILTSRSMIEGNKELYKCVQAVNGNVNLIEISTRKTFHEAAKTEVVSEIVNYGRMNSS
ncbi:hypothetical protein [Maridesulfovibrio sp.]|uniref:hypothetical protein n=1 Tax=Maridesulfovibrio sp. TaxID=2795000 RepID=UPI002A18D8C9|nr:hypothetical protein [Maridesulfovibrio sp.]